MTVAGFAEEVGPAAVALAREVGWWPSTVLAQWIDETGGGTSEAWTHGHNPAGISPGGSIAAYPNDAAGFDAWLETASSNYYNGVRGAHDFGPRAEAIALGASPWAASHYNYSGKGPGSDLLALIDQYDLTAYNGAQPAPVPPPAQEDADMELFATDSLGTGYVIAADLSSKRGIPTAADAASLEATGLYKTVQLGDGFIASIPGS